MNIDKLVLGKINNLGDVEYPVVIIKNSDIGRELKRFLDRKWNIEKIFGRILTQFGYAKDDIIVLKNIRYNEGMNVVTFEYSVNLVNNFNNRIRIDFNDFRKLIVSDKDKNVICECSITGSKDIRVIIKSVEEKMNDYKKYYRRYGYSDSEYIVRIGCREFKLYLKKFNTDNYKSLMVIDDDKKIEEYFKNIDSIVDIDKFYKDIEEYLGDIGSYNEIKLEFSKIRNNKKEVTDLLVLENGICNTFMITRGNKRVCLNGDNNWKYEDDTEFRNVSMVSNDEKITYSISASNDIVLRDESFVYGGIRMFDDTLDYVDDTKRLVKEMFPKKKRRDSILERL